MGGEICAADICAGLQRAFGQNLVPSHSQTPKPRYAFFGEAWRLVLPLTSCMVIVTARYVRWHLGLCVMSCACAAAVALLALPFT
jgi:hypothetical protein